MTNYKLFEVRDFNKTLDKHKVKMSKLAEMMEEKGLEYSDIMDSDSWQTIDTLTEDKLRMYESMGIKQTERQIARLINMITRQVMQNSLEYYELNKYNDTAFFMAHYMKTIEGMSEILENIKARRA
jgi:hypothetical protein